MADFEVHGNVSYSFSAIIEADSAEQAESLALADREGFWQLAVEQGDVPDASDIDVEFAQAWREGR
ncbi:hypothetical protein [Arthrobacter sp. 18067]|uniref:hypothetical protein n=1 Tax=Arthrobacter sp. 18067 TaxID=2681413 RepID=UPI001356EB2A|nr:hypothetical protein [Arthrobacter sp. 18067]